MNCAEADSLLHAYVDGELAGVDRSQFEAHLAGCPTCARACHLQGRFKAAVRAHLTRPAVPVELRTRIRAALGAEADVAPRRFWGWLRTPRLIPVLAGGMALLAITASVRHAPSFVFEQAKRTFQTELPMDVVATDCGSIGSWFRGRVEFPVQPPSLAGQAKCQGGRVVNVGDRTAAYLVYKHASGHRVGLLVFDPREDADDAIRAPQRRIVNGREIFIRRGPGISTAAYRDRGLGYVVTSDLDEDQLTNLVTASFHP